MDVPAVTAIRAHAVDACTVTVELTAETWPYSCKDGIRATLGNERCKPSPARLSLNVNVRPRVHTAEPRDARAPVRIRRLDLSSIKWPCCSQSQQ